MKAILPVAGVGTRLKPHTHTVAKCLMNVAGRPILQHILDELREYGIKEAVLIIGYLGDQIKEWALKTYPDMTFHFPVQEERKGLGHAILLAERFIKDEPSLIIFGDTIFEGDIKEALKTKLDGTLGCKMVDDPRRWGVVEMEGDLVVKLVEKPDYIKTMPAMVGLNVVNNSRMMFDAIRELIEKDIKTRGEYRLTDAFQIMVDKGAKLGMFKVNGWFDCGKPETLFATNKYILNKRGGHFKERKNVVIIPPVWIDDSVKITDSVIGPYVTVDKNSVIKDAIIKNSIVASDAKISYQVLTNSLVGDFAEVRGHFSVLNVGDSSQVMTTDTFLKTE